MAFQLTRGRQFLILLLVLVIGLVIIGFSLLVVVQGNNHTYNPQIQEEDISELDEHPSGWNSIFNNNTENSSGITTQAQENQENTQSSGTTEGNEQTSENQNNANITKNSDDNINNKDVENITPDAQIQATQPNSPPNNNNLILKKPKPQRPIDPARDQNELNIDNLF